jgi:hypothetical protein
MNQATGDLDAREGGEDLGYRQTARFFGVDEPILNIGEDTKGNVARVQELHMHSNYSFHNKRRYFLSVL